MTDENSIEYAKAIMMLYGINIQLIPRSDQKTPDFEFTCNDEHYVVEMKERFAEWELRDDEIKDLEAGHIIDKSEEIGYQRCIASNSRSKNFNDTFG